MVVGACCRDILQSSLGHDFTLRATADVDVGLAVANWAAYDELTDALTTCGNTGIRFQVAGMPADLMPFGPVEDPPGTVSPPARRESMSVWGFAEVFAAASPLPLGDDVVVRIPTTAGYAALKLAAWLDRSAYNEYKDASDIATVMYWYAESSEVDARLYETAHGQDVLVAEDLDSSLGAARLLGEDIAGVIGRDRLSELLKRWPGNKNDLLYQSMSVTNGPGWTASLDRRQALAEAVERGMTAHRGEDMRDSEEPPG
ncbi:hypothetical protein L083_0696 [Actinoplanes sp. N902-109]|nr:hypothetical protein L083_0696 [Actinoplanes sp. N902-109]